MTAANAPRRIRRRSLSLSSLLTPPPWRASYAERSGPGRLEQSLGGPLPGPLGRHVGPGGAGQLPALVGREVEQATKRLGQAAGCPRAGLERQRPRPPDRR